MAPTPPSTTEPPPGSIRYLSDQPQTDSYETVSRRFTWRSSLLIALVVWLALMFAISEWMVARSSNSNPAPAGDPAATSPTP